MTKVEHEILGYLSAALGNNITTYYQGEVTVPSVANMPILMVFGTDSKHDAIDTANDQITYQLTIKVVFDLLKYVSNDGSFDGTIKGQEAIRDLMEGREANGTYTPLSVAGILRSKAKLHGTYYYYTGSMKTKYTTVPNGKSLIVHAEMTFQAITDLIPRPS